MIYPVDKITIKCTGTEEDLDQLRLYWYGVAWTELRFGDYFAESLIDTGGGTITITVRCKYYISLYAFDVLAKQFAHLTFKLTARETNFSYDSHILVYQDGIKTIHINKYKHKSTPAENIKKWTTYISDHINKITRIERELLQCKVNYSSKTIYIVYNELFTNYIKREEENVKEDRKNYKVWF